MSINRGKFDHSKLSNPRIVGPGAWKTLHLLAKFSDLHKKDNYAEFIRFFCDEFRCGDCREHCGAFLNKTPPEKFKGREWGMSEHSRQFHNAANKGLGKPLMDWDTYESIWIQNDKTIICQKGCGEGGGEGGGERSREERGGGRRHEELSEINFARLRSVGTRDPGLVQVRRSDELPRQKGTNLTLVKRKK